MATYSHIQKQQFRRSMDREFPRTADCQVCSHTGKHLQATGNRHSAVMQCCRCKSFVDHATCHSGTILSLQRDVARLRSRGMAAREFAAAHPRGIPAPAGWRGPAVHQHLSEEDIRKAEGGGLPDGKDPSAPLLSAYQGWLVARVAAVLGEAE